ncbi:hypothetical protein MRX96_047917 [Rhipicephalus microplus]
MESPRAAQRWRTSSALWSSRAASVCSYVVVRGTPPVLEGSDGHCIELFKHFEQMGPFEMHRSLEDHVEKWRVFLYQDAVLVEVGVHDECPETEWAAVRNTVPCLVLLNRLAVGNSASPPQMRKSRSRPAHGDRYNYASQ